VSDPSAATAGLDTGSIADAVLAARAAVRTLEATPSARDASFDLDRAYAVAEAVRAKRAAAGERVVGWKIGFTNCTIWDRYGVHAPIWGPVWDTTLETLPAGTTEATVSLGRFVAPRLEPEIVFGLRAAPRAGMDDAALAACIDWVAHGFEIVDTHCAGWRFAAADTVADFALHGRLVVGPRVPVAAFGTGGAGLREALGSLTLELHDADRLVETGRGSNVLGGPLAALVSWVAALAASPSGWTVEPGHVVTTGTLTDAAPLAPGQTWRTVPDDARLAGLVLRTTD
jgi:2-keto-4-pentenoate hydratase